MIILTNIVGSKYNTILDMLKISLKEMKLPSVCYYKLNFANICSMVDLVYTVTNRW